jgi:uncharacterized phiE125 gp8 family phage protein
MALKLITAPTEEPVTLTEVKLHCRVDGTDEDALLTGIIIPAARRFAEGRTGRALVTQTWELALDAFPAAEIELPMPPVQSITSVKYLDTTGVEQTIDAANYALDSYGMRPWLLPAYEYEWPEALASSNAVRIRFVAGYGAAAAVPADIKAWIMLAIGTLYAQRETSSATPLIALPGDYWQSLLDPYHTFAF